MPLPYSGKMLNIQWAAFFWFICRLFHLFLNYIQIIKKQNNHNIIKSHFTFVHDDIVIIDILDLFEHV